MDSIEATDYPLVFKAGDSESLTLQAQQLDGRISVRTATRALKGMQKEAVVRYGDNGPVWRTVCDEGPWLNGTDLAPFPLGFFSAGLVASYMSEFIAHARQQEIKIKSLEVMVDNLYGMEGSLMKGTMTGSALPVNVTFRVDADAAPTQLQGLAFMAVASSPADAYLRTARDSVFSLNSNGQELPVTGVQSSSSGQTDNPDALFPRIAPGEESVALPIIEKRPEVTHLGGEKLGTVRSSGDVGLSDTQKRQVHVRGVGKLRPDGMKGIEVACFVPVGSVFHFLSDDSELCGGQGRAPSGLAYLSAGLSYCFMTQLGRYAQVAKQRLSSYRIVQDTSFSFSQSVSDTPDQPTSAPVDTHLFIDTEEGAEDSQTLLRMGEQTCYLHAACRGALKTRIQAVTV